MRIDEHCLTCDFARTITPAPEEPPPEYPRRCPRCANRTLYPLDVLKDQGVR